MNKCCNPCLSCRRKIVSTSVTATATNVVINATLSDTLQAETKYCLVLAQPVPVAGFNLPVNLVITPGEGDPVTAPLKKLFDKCGCGVCNIEFGEDLPKCRSRIPLYYINGNDFIDLRCNEHRFICK